MDVAVLRDLEETIRKEVPNFKVGFKDESSLMKLFGFLIYPFNPTFMTGYTTTAGTTVYFPTRAFYENAVGTSVSILTHEYVHLWDKKQNRLFGLTYVFPQLFTLIGFLVFGVIAWPFSWILLLPVVGYLLASLVGRKTFDGFIVIFGVALMGALGLAIWLTRWNSIVLGAALACLSPWPALARTEAELRSYTMNLAMRLWVGEKYTTSMRDSFVQEFVGPSYYFMSWSRSKIETAFDDAATLILNGGLQGSSPPYATIYDFLYRHSLLRR